MKATLKCALMALAIMGSSFAAQAQQDDDLKARINEAVMKVYNEELDANPNDYLTLNGRANQYFVMEDYLRALDDVTRAISLTPEKDTETLFEEYMLRAKIYDARGDKENRLADLYSANKIDPSKINCLGLLAETNYSMGRYDDAEPCYQRILRLQPNNFDALAGLGRIEVKRNNFGKAAEYVDRAVKLYSAEPAVYINRAEVLIMMEQYEPAAQDLISALSVGKNNDEAIEALADMSDVQYDAVMAALVNSINKAPRNGLFYYLAAQIAMDHNHFADAEYYFNLINENNLYDYHSIYGDLANSQYALGKYKEALENVNVAIKAAEDVPEYYVLRSKIQRATGDYAAAATSAKLAITLNADHVDALTEQALVFIAQDKNKEALSSLNLALMNNPESAPNTLLRAWLYKNRLNMADEAKQDYVRVLLNEEESMDSYRGLALHELGRDEEALNWATQVVQEGILPGGEAYYVAAVVAGACGDKDKGMSYIISALANGYGNYHNLTQQESPVVNVDALKDIKLTDTLKRFDSAFKAKRLTEFEKK